MWRCYLTDTMTGLVGAPIDVPRLSWTLSVSDSSLSTERDKGLGALDATGLSVPWTAVPGTDAAGRDSALAPWRRSVMLAWDACDGSDPVPWVVGAIGQRTDGELDTSFSLVSPMAMLSQRYAVREGVYGSAAGSTSTDAVSLSGLSLRAIACEVVRLCTSAKPAGTLPVDLPYIGESGTHQRTYSAYDVANLDGEKLLAALANVDGGPDIQLRPYLADASHVRLRMEAGSDSEPALSQTGLVRTLTWWPGGGSLQGLEVAHLGPVMRVYGSGAGTDAATLGHLSEDLALCQTSDPWPLAEATASDTDWDSADLVRSHSDARLAASAWPLVQFRGKVDLGDADVPAPGEVWPGQLVELDVQGHPSLPDGVYPMRLMECAGDLTDQVQLTFDPIRDPWVEPTVYREA